MGASFVTFLRNSSAGAWVVLALTVFLPLLAFLVFIDLSGDFEKYCTPGLLFRNEIRVPCFILRIASFGVSAAGAFFVIVLLWWLLTELIGLRRIFEVPWFGVGDDVENVGVVESVLRAGVFVVMVWIALSLSGLTFIGMSGTPVDKPKPNPEVGGGNESSHNLASGDFAPLIAAASKIEGEAKAIRDQLAKRLQSSGTDPAIVPQLQRIGDDLRDIQSALRSQDGKLDELQIDGHLTGREQDRKGAAILDETRRLSGALGEARNLIDAQGRKLDALQQIDSRLTRWEQDRKDAAILDETKRLNGGLDEARKLLNAQDRKLASMEDFERWLRDLDVRQVPAIAGKIGAMNNVVTEVHRLARAQGDALDRIEHVLDHRPTGPKPPHPTQPVDETSCLERSAVAGVVSTSTAPRRYGRTLLVFFDKSGTILTPGAVNSLRELADELRRVDQPSVSISGSADAQGDPDVSAQYAEQRAQVVRQFLEANVPQLGVRLTSARSGDEPQSEPYNRVARVEARGTCR